MFKITRCSVVLFHTILLFIENDASITEDKSSDVGQSSTNLRIIDGSVIPKPVPYQAYLRPTTSSETRTCSGSLISQNYILTAAQCLDEANFIHIWLGLTDLTSQGGQKQMLESVNYTIHESFNRTTLEYDIGLILISDVDINEVVNVVELPSREEVDVTYADQTVTVSGWGQVNETQVISEDLLITNSTVVPDLICWETFGYFHPYEICTLSEGGACNGDIGGPVVLNNKLIGVISRVEETCKEGYIPNISTKTALFLDWIQSQINA